MSWVALHAEVKALFFQRHPLDIEFEPHREWLGDGWLYFDPTERDDTPHTVRAQRRRDAGKCTRCRAPLAPGSKSLCAYHVLLNRPANRTIARAAAPNECPVHRRVLRLHLPTESYRCTKKGCTYLRPGKSQAMMRNE